MLNLATLTPAELASELAAAEYNLHSLTPGDAAHAHAEGQLTDLLVELHSPARQEVDHADAA